MWLARDKDRTLYLYSSKPIKREDMNFWDLDEEDRDEYVNQIDSRLFPEVTYENSPQEIKISFVNKEIEFYEG